MVSKQTHETLNNRYFSQFGEVAGKPKFCWKLADEMFFLERRGVDFGECAQLESGLLVPRDLPMEKRCYNEIYGTGAIKLAELQGIPAGAKAGDIAQACELGGAYYSIVEGPLVGSNWDDAKVEMYTKCMADLIRELLDSRSNVWDARRAVASSKAARDYEDAETRRNIDDQIDDRLTAFLNIPGKKLHVSFGI